MQDSDKKALVHNMVISCAYGMFFIFFKVNAFTELFEGDKVFSSFSLVDYLFCPALLKVTLWYLICFLMVYCVAGGMSVFVSIQMIRNFGLDKRTQTLVHTLYLAGGLYLAHVFNALVYPNTGTARLSMVHLTVAGIICVFWAVSLILLSVRLLKRIMGTGVVLFAKYTGGGMILCVVCFAAYGTLVTRGNEIGQTGQPNIIIVGIDSLAPTLTGLNKTRDKSGSITPNIDHFLRRATIFENAWTPFARTYPAWMSVLTGTYPVNSGARFNLIDPNDLNKTNRYLAEVLKQQGYQTLFGTDEKRFSNIDQYYGFETLIGPKMGAADFLLAPVLDTPLTNVLINTRLGKFLFPFNHSNRAIHDTYQPESFIKNVKQAINNLTGKPVFLCLHLCLPHWPYTWAEKNDSDKDAYRASIVRADQQFGRLMDILDPQLLENALVFVISDHGESQGPLADNQSVFRSEAGTPLHTRMMGHGTYVVDRTQARIVMGVQGFGSIQSINRITLQPASLIDVFPTILEMTGTTLNHSFDGISLAPWILEPQNPGVTHRYLLVESGFNPGDVMGKKVVFSKNDIGKMIATGLNSYRITPGGRIVLKKQALNDLYAQKQYAVFFKHRAVARIPGKNKSRTIGIDYKKKTWVQLAPGSSNNTAYERLLDKFNDLYKRRDG